MTLLCPCLQLQTPVLCKQLHPAVLPTETFSLLFFFFFFFCDSTVSPPRSGRGKTGLPVPPSGGSREIAARQRQSPSNKGEHPSLPPPSLPLPGFGRSWESCHFPAQPEQGERLGLMQDGRGAGNLILCQKTKTKGGKKRRKWPILSGRRFVAQLSLK